MKLTIAIPTYNRNDILLANLKRLLPQLTPECALLIIDNCSDVPVARTLSETLAAFPRVAHRIERNRANIGGNANVVRCFELCETEWVWVLGDDDQILPTAIDTISRHLDAHSECLFINFAVDELRPRTMLTQGLEEFSNQLDPSADIPWVSSSVYKASEMLKYLKFGFQATYSMLPHVAMLLVALAHNRDSGLCYFSRERIVDKDWAQYASTVAQQWSLINLALGFPTLLDLPLPTMVRTRLARKLLVRHDQEGIRLRVLAYQLLFTGLADNDYRAVLYYYDQIVARLYYFDQRLQRRAELFCYRLMLRYPAVTKHLFRLLKRRELTGHNLQDRYERM